ncbi:hypothetical protein CJ030_MR2G006987 [Morella rubra]|uniref:Uncharacterized protein n=1 Tax=Morella rubra TaxID=262757 RepID=A0A6A1W9R1_9ROSI|nr:hypothetical protein CJ030_MR2G006987 [Morella rubra]
MACTSQRKHSFLVLQCQTLYGNDRQFSANAVRASNISLNPPRDWNNLWADLS